MGKDNTFIATLLLLFIIVSIFGFDYVITTLVQENVGTITGKAESQTGTVRVEVLAANVTPTITRGGGGRGVAGVFSLAIGIPGEEETAVLRLTAKVHEIKRAQLTLTNTGDVTLHPKITDTLSILTIAPTQVTVRPNQKETVTLEVFATTPGISMGVISFVDASYLVKHLPVIITVEPEETIFRLAVNIPETFKIVLPGKELFAQVVLEHLEGRSVSLRYSIKNIQNEDFFVSEEQLPVQKSLALDKTLQLPETISPGDYALAVEATYLGEKQFAADSFAVVPLTTQQIETPAKAREDGYVIPLLLILLLLLLSLFYKRKKRSFTPSG